MWQVAAVPASFLSHPPVQAKPLKAAKKGPKEYARPRSFPVTFRSTHAPSSWRRYDEDDLAFLEKKKQEAKARGRTGTKTLVLGVQGSALDEELTHLSLVCLLF